MDVIDKVNVKSLINSGYLPITPSWPTERYTCLERILVALKKLRNINEYLYITQDLPNLEIDEVWIDGIIQDSTLSKLVEEYNQVLFSLNELYRLKYTRDFIKYIKE